MKMQLYSPRIIKTNCFQNTVMTIKGWDMLLGEFMVQILNSRNVDKVQMADRNSYFAD